MTDEQMRSIRPLVGHPANGWPESLSKPLCSKTSLHTAVSQGPSRALLEELQETIRGEDEEECLRAASPLRFLVLLCAAFGVSGGPTLIKYCQPSPCPCCSEIHSLWLESPRFPGESRASGGLGVSREESQREVGAGHAADGPRIMLEPAVQL